MMTDHPSSDRGSGRVSVVVPFFGDRAAALAARDRLLRLHLEPGDELIVADNTPDGVFEPDPGGASMRVVRATAERSSYHARNVGAEAAAGEWLLFLDADCRPPADLIARYLREPVDPRVAILAGPIAPAEQSGLLPEWAATREILSQERSAARRPAGAATANMMVRREAWARAGGFLEGIRSGGDYEFCWRIADDGGRLELRSDAVVEHLHRTTLRGVLRQMGRYAAGNAWQRRRRRGSSPPGPGARDLARAAGGFLFFGLTLRPRRAALKAVDGAAQGAQISGRLLSNTVAGPLVPAAGRLVVATDRFPVASETFIRGEIDALRELGLEVRVEAIARADRPVLGAGRGLEVRHLEDEARAGRAAALGWAVARHPLRCAADLWLRRRFDAEERMPLSAIAPMARRLAAGGERHVHVHFAALAAVNALRAGRIARVPVSIAAHGHEVYASPRALPQKIARAAFVAAPCEYTAAHLRALAPKHADRIHVVVMGVDARRFARARPHPEAPLVAAVGRLTEKKGFADLVEAAAALSPGSLERVVIAGEGPLRAALEARAETHDLGERVRLVGRLEPAEVRELLEGAAVFAMPCVVAADGDRDAMPVVVKEALAMEVPVVATREVGLPEVVQDGWGRLVPPRDPRALAAALAELLALPVEERARMGAAGREFVATRFDTRVQARRLAELIGTAVARH
jgi:colanic acid/amylovoran biosynthesis glycosyltransferase